MRASIEHPEHRDQIDESFFGLCICVRSPLKAIALGGVLCKLIFALIRDLDFLFLSQQTFVVFFIVVVVVEF